MQSANGIDPQAAPPYQSITLCGDWKRRQLLEEVERERKAREEAVVEKPVM
ncbi:MAG TPA: hypothetical protein VKE40_22415 [Gemmataceae bacterium]|nr:hypothetical protein [Gemmataceae bacterium]